jgi:uncharacterized membrane protein
VVAVVLLMGMLFKEHGGRGGVLVDPVAVVRFFAKMAVVIVTLVLLGMGMAAATPFLRDEENQWSQTLRHFVVWLIVFCKLFV